MDVVTVVNDALQSLLRHSPYSLECLHSVLVCIRSCEKQAYTAQTGSLTLRRPKQHGDSKSAYPSPCYLGSWPLSGT